MAILQRSSKRCIGMSVPRSRGFMRQAGIVGRIPLRFQGGVVARSNKWCEASFAAQTGWLVISNKIRSASRASRRRLRDVLLTTLNASPYRARPSRPPSRSNGLIARAPLLENGGEWGLLLCLFLLLACAPAFAQGRGQRGAPQAAKAIAPVDFTGYWVSVVSEDWRHRMTTPRKGDYESLPLNAEGRRVADTWDLAKDTQAGVQCKPFGIGGIMRQPGRLHITWQDDNTLKIDFDAGTQSRLLYFDKSK